MDDYDYIKKMDRIGFILIGSVLVITIIGLTLYNMGHEIASNILMGFMIFFAAIMLIYAKNSNKKRFAKGEVSE